MIDTILLAGALLSVQAGSATPSTEAVAEVDTRRECRVVGETGSRLARRRVCGTRAEWAEKDRLDRQAMNDGRQRTLAPVYDELIRGSRAGPSGGIRPTTRCARC
jgi:hypothetical protein